MTGIFFTASTWSFTSIYPNANIEKRIIQTKDKRSFYRLLRKRLKSRPDIPSLSSCDGATACTDSEKAEMLANTFELSYSILARHTSTAIAPQFPPMADSMWFHADDILRTLLRWPSSFSDTTDHIPFIFIKKTSCVLVQPLEFLFNLSFMKSEVPSRYRFSLVTPVLKKSPGTCPNNYRPISITSIFARLLGSFSKSRSNAILKTILLFLPFNMVSKR